MSIKMPNFAVCMETKKSIFQRASEWGVPFGLYLACGGMSFIFADWFAPLGLVFFVLFFATPIVVYYFQRRKFIEDDGFTEYSALWSQLFCHSAITHSSLKALIGVKVEGLWDGCEIGGIMIDNGSPRYIPPSVEKSCGKPVQNLSFM